MVIRLAFMLSLKMRDPRMRRPNYVVILAWGPAAGGVFGLDYARALSLHCEDSVYSTGLALAVVLLAIWTSYLVHPL